MKTIPMILIVLALASCQSTQKFQAQNCNRDGAYEQGANDAKHGKDLQGEALVSKCPAEAQAEVRKGYREGYDEYAEKNKSFVDVIKDKMKTISQDKPVTCKENKSGTEVCGYGCAELNGEVKCAKKPTHACVGIKNEIACGLNCREKSAKVVCDERETL